MKLLTTLANIQSFAAIISFIAAVVVVAVVVFLIGTSSTAEERLSAKHKVYWVRGRYFFGLVSIIIILLFVSLRLLPYTPFQGRPQQTVTVVGMQWAWKMVQGAPDKDPAELTGSNEITLPAHQLIRFVVTSTDVNHNFAIYNKQGTLVAQTQAMPKYSNELEYSFADTGDYHILCLEYCGMPHGYMFGTIHVN